MIRYVGLPLIVTLVALLSFGKVHSQVITTRPGADTMKIVQLINADRLSYKHPDSLTDLQILAGNVQLRQDNTVINCDSAVFNKKTRYVEAFGNVHIVDNDTVNIRSQYLQYYVDTKMAYLKNNVSLTDNKSVLTTNDLTYDMNLKIGEYHNGGKLVSKESVLTSKEGTYYEELKDVYFKRNVDLKDPQYTLKTDSLLYNTNTQIATFIAPTTIVDSSKRTIKTKDGFYDTQNRKAFFGKRPTLNDGAVRITADNVDSDNGTGKSILRGNAVYVDTAQGVSVLANFIEADNKEGTFWATQRPLMIIKQDQDSIYITADTLASGRISTFEKLREAKRVRDSINQVTAEKAAADSAAKKAVTRIEDRLQPRSLKFMVSNSTMGNLSLNKDSASGRPEVVIDTTLAKTPEINDSVELIADSTKQVVTDTALAKIPQLKDSLQVLPDSAKQVVTDTALVKVPVIKDSVSLPRDSVKLAVKDKVPVKKPAVTKTPAPQAKQAANKPAKPATENKNDSTDRYFQAWNHVRIYTDSMQAVSDSLWYSGKDSIFRLFRDPVLWASKSQITGDTIFLYTKNKKPDRMNVWENGFAINTSDSIGAMFNQIKGNRLNGYFKNGEIDYMRATGNGESIYYVKDEKGKLVGINNATSDIIDMRFKNKELNKVVFISEVNGTMYPIKQAKEENKQLRNFKWLEDRRPKTKFELFEDIKKPVILKDSTLMDSTLTDSTAVDSLHLDSVQVKKQLDTITNKQLKVDQPKVPSKQPAAPSTPPADKKEPAALPRKKP
ncbi:MULTISPECIES: OstA-like protein [Niastella]|uniref:LPS export ABC transporter periplasmic protein LptC n=1 Tax=Niastella soli TaxID=2821487 RepID=A0ABS3YXJ0_9BACT|nr:OstA-like protein [Niastella soli]MBO9202635.1 LPS export ABC transporter periplasmic protein LptC [Niastella soli]